MKTNPIKTEKHNYISPTIVKIKLDNEISLALESSPPLGPNETANNAPEYFNNDPFKSNLG